MSQNWANVDIEAAAFEAEVRGIEAWRRTDRQKHIKRPYSAESIAALRNINFKFEYASSAQGRKLWHMLQEHRARGTYELTFGTTEPLIVKEMASTMQTVYVSGALCGLSLATWPGEDHADYPSDLVPSVVKRIFNSQLFHDQRQTQLRMRYSKADRKDLDCIDYVMPIVADADMGFGTLTGCMKLIRGFVDVGVAMVHIDDLAMGMKKFTTGEGWTIVPTSEYLARLKTVRMTYDIMGLVRVLSLGFSNRLTASRVDTMLLCRCDTYAAEFITSVQDPRDHPYILGATKPVVPLAEAWEVGQKVGRTYLDVKAEWITSAGLLTFDEAVASTASSDQYDLYLVEVAIHTLSLQQRRAAAC